MTQRLRIEHRTGYEYSDSVAASYNEARITPRTDARQTVLDHHVYVQPAAYLYEYQDYFGSTVQVFDLHAPHSKLVVTGRTVVETGAETTILETDTVSWDDVGAVSDQMFEYLTPSEYVPFDHDIAGKAAEFRSESTPVRAFRAVNEWLSEHLIYERGATNVSTTAPEAFWAARGVCQDFAHLDIALLRSLNIPARYASGYLLGDPDPEVGARTSGESHAWIEAWLGQWYAFDPTNRLPIGSRHVLVARGRDYGDVAPLRGIYRGGAPGELEVEVVITRLN